MIEQKTVSIKGEDYLLTHMPAGRGVRILKQLGKLAGPALASMAAAEAENKVMEAVSALFDNIDTVDVETLLKELVQTVSKSNMAINYDTEFAGAYDKLFMLVQEVVEFNFGSVFTLLGSDVL